MSWNLRARITAPAGHVLHPSLRRDPSPPRPRSRTSPSNRSTPAQVLIPAAIGGVITEANAGKLDCKLVIEAANGPTTPEGDKILRERGITVLPGA